MRKLVPVLLACLFSISAQASFETPWSEYSPCSSASGALAGSCDMGKKRFCQMADVKTGDCKMNAPAITAADLAAKMDSFVNGCDQARTQVEKFCRPRSAASTIPNDAEGLKEACDKLKNETDKGSAVNQAQSGECRARIHYCNAKCAQVRKSIDQTCGADPNACIGLDSKRNMIAADINSCAGISPDVFDDQTRNLEVAKALGAKCDQLAGGGKDDPPGGKDPAGGGGGGGGGDGGASKDGGTGGKKPQSQNAGMGAMLPALMQMAQGLMNKQQPQQQAQFQPPVDAVDCNVNPQLMGCECKLYPNLPQCPKDGKSDSYNTGEAQVASVEPSGAGEFNVGDNDGYKTASADPQAPKMEQQAALTGAGVPNGGGAMPGGGGGGAASLGGGGGGGYAGGPGAKTDILNGFSGGGGALASVNSGMNMKNGEGGGGYTYGGGFATGNEDNVDLSQFFSSGKSNPIGRQLAGTGLGMDMAQIQSSKVNIWFRISERFKARCDLGLLDCPK